MFSFSSFIQNRKRQRRFEAINRALQKEQRYSAKDADVYDHILTGNHHVLQKH